MSDKPIDPQLHELLTNLELYWNHLIKLSSNLENKNTDDTVDFDIDIVNNSEALLKLIVIELFEVIKSTGFILEIMEQKKQKGISLSDLLDSTGIETIDDWKDPNKHKGDNNDK